MTPIVVQKYGGSSVGDIKRIQSVADHIHQTKEEGFKVIAVVSAMGKTTDDLLNLAHRINGSPSNREMDALLATGEQVSTALLSLAIEALGLKVISLTGAQCGILTDAVFAKAKINAIHSERLLTELEKHDVVIVAGFQGVTSNGDVTTLGRGGSDTSAVAVAAHVKANKCEIFTDVLGIYSTDPRRVSKAKLLCEIGYDEMLEMSKLGAQVMHPRSVALAKKFSVPLWVRSSFDYSHQGTQIKEVNPMEGAVVRGITLDESIARVSVPNVPDQPGIAYKLFSSLIGLNVAIDMIVQNLNHDGLNDISFTVQKDDLAIVLPNVEAFISRVGASPVRIKSNVAKLSIVGTGVTSDVKIAAGLFEKIYALGINIEMISTSETRLSAIIDTSKAQEALEMVHLYFFP